MTMSAIGTRRSHHRPDHGRGRLRIASSDSVMPMKSVIRRQRRGSVAILESIALGSPSVQPLPFAQTAGCPFERKGWDPSRFTWAMRVKVSRLPSYASEACAEATEKVSRRMFHVWDLLMNTDVRT